MNAEVSRKRHELVSFELLVEDAGTDGCLGHIPALPGLCFRVETPEESEKTAASRIAEYGRWLLSEGLADLTPETAALSRQVLAGEPSVIRIAIAEHVAGAPVWKSGNPAVLFDHDRRTLADDTVAAHLQFVRRVLDRMRELVRPLSSEQLAGRPAPDRRSVDETLTHVGNCIWWYCSRVDDVLPEPEEPSGESPMGRADRLFAAAAMYLLGIPLSARAAVHVPKRFPTSDPHECWTHTKVCRRQAEHVWAHLPGLQYVVESLRRP